jgi:hypothetical protein
MKQYPLEFMPKQYNCRDSKERSRVADFNECGARIASYLNSQMLSSNAKVREFGAFEIGRTLKIDTEVVSAALCYLGAGTNGIIVEK